MAHTDPSPFAQERRTAVTNVRVFDGHKYDSQLVTVFIRGDHISEGPIDGAEVIDGEGGVLMPGLIDSHVHLETEDDLRKMTSYGITTALDMATWPTTKLNQLRGVQGLTDIRSPGVPATCAGSIHSKVMPLPPEALVSDPQMAVKFVQDRIAEGADYIKAIADVPGPDQATLSAIGAAAHEHGKLLVVHATTRTPFAMAIEAGADVITHSPRDEVLDAGLIGRMVAENIIAVPTLTMMKGLSQRPKWGTLLGLLLHPILLFKIIFHRWIYRPANPLTYENARDSVSAMYRAGVAILAGTDSNSVRGIASQVDHGASLHDELELLVEAGLSTLDALKAATSLSAQHFGLHDRGIIRPGKRADLLLLSGNPVEDIRETRAIKHVWLQGAKRV